MAHLGRLRRAANGLFPVAGRGRSGRTDPSDRGRDGSRLPHTDRPAGPPSGRGPQAFRLCPLGTPPELSQHLESLDRRMTLVRQGVTSEPNLDSLRTWASSVDAFPVAAWARFLSVGGLHRLLDSAPDQVASNLYRYYHGVGTFNNEAALRE